MALGSERSADAGLRQLRHDLLNRINVLTGLVDALLQSDLDRRQRAWARMLVSTTRQLQEIVERIDRYDDGTVSEGRERLADLCSIAAARLGKPFNRARLLDTIQRVTASTRGRILLVDDADELAVVVHGYLKSTEWTLDIVDSGERAVAQATTERYDVVLMDIDLPGIDGATAAHAIRAAELARGTSPTPIVAMTAYDYEARGNTPGGTEVVERLRRT